MKLRTDLILRAIGDDFMIVEPGQGTVDMSRVFKLNSTAASIWNEFQGKRIDSMLVENYLMENYTVTQELAIKDARAIVEDFQSKGFVCND